jgi:hypothetical protein
MKDTRRSTRDEDGRRVEDPTANAAVFAVERVGRARPPVVVFALVLVVAGLAVAGALEGTSRAPVAPAAVALDVPSPTARPVSKRFLEGPDAPVARSDQLAGRGPRASLLQLDAQVVRNLVLVHGDVLTRDAVVVVVAVGDARSRSIEIRAVELPSGSTAFRIGANDRFDLAFELEETNSMPAAWVTASAYDRAGAVIATARTRVLAFVIEAPAAYRT